VLNFAFVNSSDVDFYPMYWGDRKINKWLAQEAAFNQSNLPPVIIGQNEPDVNASGESSGESPSQSVAGWIKHLAQYQKRGVRVTSPQIVWNFGWLDSFMSQLSKAGYEPDIVAAHWYGGWDDLDTFKAYVQKLRCVCPECCLKRAVALTLSHRTLQGALRQASLPDRDRHHHQI
jgi:Glycosyl hydrolase catalytic core